MCTLVFPQTYHISVGRRQTPACFVSLQTTHVYYNDYNETNIIYLVILTPEEIKNRELSIQPCEIGRLIYVGHLLDKGRGFVVGVRGLVKQAVNSLSMEESKINENFSWRREQGWIVRTCAKLRVSASCT